MAYHAGRSSPSKLLAALPSAFVLAACAVSFDGYELDDDAGNVAGASGAGGDGAGGSTGGTGGGSVGGSEGVGGTIGTGAAGGAAGMGGSGASVGSGGSGGTGASGAGGSGGSAAAGGAGGGSGGAGATGGASGGAGGTGGAGGGGTGGSGGSGGSVSCPSAMQQVPSAGGGVYCIDQTEVTNAQYGEFLANPPAVGSQIAACSWNTSFAPATSTNCAAPLPYDPINRSNYPVSCVDWCDAYAYCEAAGKRLCGRPGGGPTPVSGLNAAASSEWYNACSMGGSRSFPYGNLYVGDRCNGVDYPSTATIPVQSAAQCQGGYPLIYDMSGNVREWENGCSGSSGASDSCAERGGSYLDDQTTPPQTLQCGSAPLAPRSDRSRLRGFRCCSDG